MSTIVLTNAIATSFEELDGSPTESMDDGVFKAVRTLKCAWADRLTLMAELLGRSFTAGSDLISYQAHAYPPFPTAWARSVQIKPFHGPAAASGSGGSLVAVYTANGAELTVTYSTDANEASSGGGSGDSGGTPLVSESLEPGGEVLMMPGRKFKWSTSGSHLEDIESPARIVTTTVWVYRRHRLQTLPSALIDNAGTINDAAVVSATLGRTFGVSELLYEPGSFRRTIMADGGSAWDVELRFSHKPNRWDRFWDAATGSWDALKLIADSSTFAPYETSDFGLLTA